MSERIRAERCGFEGCRSRRWRRDPDGYLYCENGHRKEGGLEAVAEDEDMFNLQGAKTRKQREQRDKVFTHYQGKKAFGLYLQCYQLILWKQVHWLIHSKQLPVELETITRDLWSLRLQKLADRLSDDTDSALTPRYYSSQSETETTETEREQGRSRSLAQRPSKTPRLIETLALLCIAALLLRLPYTPGDFAGWASHGEIVYIRAIKEIPAEMKARLPGPYHEALEAPTALRADALQEAIGHLVAFFEKWYGMQTPALNTPIVLWRFVREISVPLEVYPMVLRLKDLLGYSFGWSRKQGPNEDISSKQSRASMLNNPVVQLAALVVVSTKLIAPFERTKVYPATVTEPAALDMSWDTWNQANERFHQMLNPSDGLRFEDAMKVVESDVPVFSNKRIDQYLNWFSQVWTAEEEVGERNGDFTEYLLQEFPCTQSQDERSQFTASMPVTLSSPTADREFSRTMANTKIRTVQSSLRPRKVIVGSTPHGHTPSAIIRPGSQYHRYRSIDEVPEIGKIFYQKVADLAGLGIKSLVSAVFQTEQRLWMWSDGVRKQELEALKAGGSNI